MKANSLFHSLQETMNEISGEMLGNKQWRTDVIDRYLLWLREEIADHFGLLDELTEED